MKLIKIFLPLLLSSWVVACSTTSTDPATVYKNQSAAEIFHGGDVALAKRDYSSAIQHFEGLDALYPFGPNAEQSQLDLMYAYYQTGDNASAVAAAERFIKVYPRDTHTDYAYYIKGLANFDQDRGWLLNALPIDISLRDAGTMTQSFDDFNTLIRLYPTSPYVPDARQHMVYLRNMFAEHEWHVAQYYWSRSAYVAAANRAAYIVQHYNGTPQVEKALGMMVRCYRKIGLQPAAQQALAVLQLNYPHGKVLQQLQKK